MKITNRQRDTMLAALRLWQSEGHRPLGLEEIATNGNTHTTLDWEEINDLCEQINVEQEEVNE